MVVSHSVARSLLVARRAAQFAAPFPNRQRSLAIRLTMVLPAGRTMEDAVINDARAREGGRPADAEVPIVAPAASQAGMFGRALRVLEAHPTRGAASAVLTGMGMVAGEQLWTGIPAILFVLYVVIAASAFLSGLTDAFRQRDPRRPRLPRRRTARRPSVPREPPRRIHEIAHNCVICGRPLTNPESMRARVGSTCIKRYGPRFKMIVNPDHVRWTDLVATAEAERAAEQKRLDADFETATRAYDQARRAWAEEVASEAGQERRRRRRAASRLMLASVASAPLLLVGIALALAPS